MNNTSEDTKVVNCKVQYIRPKYKNLKEWTADANNVYIGRKGIVFIENANNKKERYPKEDSIWANPFKITKDRDRDQVLILYKNYIKEKLENNPELIKSLLELESKNLGCWCHPEACHGNILVELINYYKS